MALAKVFTGEFFITCLGGGGRGTLTDTAGHTHLEEGDPGRKQWMSTEHLPPVDQVQGKKCFTQPSPYYYPLPNSEETEAQRSAEICPRSQSSWLQTSKFSQAWDTLSPKYTSDRKSRARSPSRLGASGQKQKAGLEQQQVSSNSAGKSLLWAWAGMGCRGTDRQETMPLGAHSLMVDRWGSEMVVWSVWQSDMHGVLGNHSKGEKWQSQSPREASPRHQVDPCGDWPHSTLTQFLRRRCSSSRGTGQRPRQGATQGHTGKEPG